MRIFFTLFLIAITFSLQAEPVDSAKAVQIASAFFAQKENNPVKLNLKSAHSHQLSITKFSASQNKRVDLYVINMPDDGFVIVSGDTKAPPVIAFSLEGNITDKNMPEALRAWMEWKGNEIKKLSETSVNSASASSDWTSFEKSNIKSTQVTVTKPLIKTTWDQGDYYNDLCPQDLNSDYENGRVPAGCVAIAMAQVLNFWEYPARGTGSNSYSSSYGILSADFSNTYYDYHSMADYLESGNPATATLIYHCGVSVNMEYGPDGSSSSILRTWDALIDNFSYSSESIDYADRDDYTVEEWNALIKDELDSKRPVIYRGSDELANTGHAFICDGYYQDFFHINWGWSGSYNGYFLMDALNPGNNDFNFYQGALVGVQPSSGSLALYPKVMSLSYESGSSNELRIVTNGNWNISSNASWLSFSTTSGNGFSMISIIAQNNNTNAQRSAIVTVQSNGITKTMTVNQISASDVKPNLIPYNPNWDDVIVLSNVTKTSTNSKLYPTDQIYLDIAFANDGDKNTEVPVRYEIKIDGKSVINEVSSSNLEYGYYYYIKDMKLDQLPEGNHTINMILDPDNVIIESNENDNTYGVTFTVSHKSLPNLALNKPSNWEDGIIVSNKRKTNTNNLIFDTDSVFVDISCLNNGETATELGFLSDLYLNDDYVKSVVYGNLNQGESIKAEDLKFNVLPAGEYELMLWLDSEEQIDESDEDDNSCLKSFTVYEAASSLSVNPEIINIEAASATKNVGINCIGNWKVETTANWISYNKTAGTGNDNINIIVSANTTTVSRTADVVISNAVISKTITVTQNGVATAVDDEMTSKIKVYPNPAQDRIFVNSADFPIKRITILDSRGMIILETENKDSDGGIDISALPCGIYFLIIDTEGKQVHSKIIKQ